MVFKQRLAFAHASVGNPPVFLLDEVAGGLDTESEHLVQDASSKLTKGRLAITIAHSLLGIKRLTHLFLSNGGFQGWG